MPRSYDISPETNEEEKAIGGILTFAQFFWLLGGAGLGFLFYMLVFFLIKIQLVSLFLGIVVALSGIPFAFVKKHELSLFKYFLTKRNFDKKSKKLINKREIK